MTDFPIWKISVGDCVEVMRSLPESSIDAVVTDPPYGLRFMGKGWDSMGHGSAQQAWHFRWAEQAQRVLKPGGHLLSFGGSRTYHRMAAAVEDAGFEIRDMIQWLYGQGFPKSMNVGKAIDKAAGAEREVVGTKLGRPGYRAGDQEPSTVLKGGADGTLNNGDAKLAITAPATPEAEQWEGWGTALKPAQEPIVLARKPLIGTVAENVLEHGTGALNIEASRIETGAEGRPKREADYKDLEGSNVYAGRMNDSLRPGSKAVGTTTEGRFPANVVLTHHEECVAWHPESVECHPDCPAGIMDRQAGGSRSGDTPKVRRSDKTRHVYGAYSGPENPEGRGASLGEVSRFFYCAKARKSERNAGLEDQNNHPTVKPIDLMRYLSRMVTPPGGVVLDPFAGSGSTGLACLLEGFKFIGIEIDAEYAEIAKARIRYLVNGGQI